MNLFYEKTEPTTTIMQLGGSGVLYPPKSLYIDAFNKEIFMKHCPLADDIWLNAMAILNKTRIVKTNYDVYLMPLLFKENSELYKVNVLGGENNQQILALNRVYGGLF